MNISSFIFPYYNNNANKKTSANMLWNIQGKHYRLIKERGNEIWNIHKIYMILYYYKLGICVFVVTELAKIQKKNKLFSKGYLNKEKLRV